MKVKLIDGAVIREGEQASIRAMRAVAEKHGILTGPEVPAYAAAVIAGMLATAIKVAESHVDGAGTMTRELFEGLLAMHLAESENESSAPSSDQN